MKYAASVKADNSAAAQSQGRASILRQCRSSCFLYPQIRQTLSVEFPALPNSRVGDPRIPATLSPESVAITLPGTIQSPPSIRQTLPSNQKPTLVLHQSTLPITMSAS
ncbi:MAG: hypothetical protein ABIQ96_11430 [Luteolibacter sp.]